MTNSDVITMLNCGILNLTAHSLEAAPAYKVTKFKNELRRISEAWNKTREGLAKEAEIDDLNVFYARLKELSEKDKKSKEESKELDELKAKDKRFADLINAALREEVSHEIKTMPYDAWKALQDENKEIKATINNNGVPTTIELLVLLEPQLEEVLWKAPTE